MLFWSTDAFFVWRVNLKVIGIGCVGLARIVYIEYNNSGQYGSLVMVGRDRYWVDVVMVGGQVDHQS